nr:60 kDa SS-A/Ro ribonucleoprotein-like isoform X2 [Ciona intestinalis]|eukprot:XP_002124207.1 60 kDa SS-A/Ro ribonucleoprotein-like isoform X2 [Ciona intestinalis]
MRTAVTWNTISTKCLETGKPRRQNFGFPKKLNKMDEDDLDLLLFDQLVLEPQQAVTIEAEPLVLNSEGDIRLVATATSQLLRFLTVGCEEGNVKVYNISPSLTTPDNVNTTAVYKLNENGKGLSVLSTLVKFAKKGNAYVEGAIPYVLAVCACSKDAKVKQDALNHVGVICNRPRMILEFVAYCEEISKNISRTSGWGRGRKRAVQKWYSNKRSYEVAFAVTSCSTVNHWSHKDVLRLCHLNPANSLCLKILCMYIARGYQATENAFRDEIAKSDEADAIKLMELLGVIRKLKNSTVAADSCALIEKHNLTWGHIPCKLRNNAEVWKCLIPKLGMAALIRNLPRFHHIGVLVNGNIWTKQILQRLFNDDSIEQSELHPYSFLLHHYIYAKGESARKEMKWIPDPLISQALDAAFYTAIPNVKATNKRICITLDASKSMKAHIVNSHCLECRVVAAAMCLVFSKVEKDVTVQGFSSQLTDIDIGDKDTVKSTVEKIDQIPLGGTDCSRPMIKAKKEKKPFDVFIVITDKETWKGKTSPHIALKQYREEMQIPAKFILISLAVRKMEKDVDGASDRGMLSICGFNESVPDIIHDFICDEF